MSTSFLLFRSSIERAFDLIICFDVQLYKEDGGQMVFESPRVQANTATNTYVLFGDFVDIPGQKRQEEEQTAEEYAATMPASIRQRQSADELSKLAQMADTDIQDAEEREEVQGSLPEGEGSERTVVGGQSDARATHNQDAEELSRLENIAAGDAEATRREGVGAELGEMMEEGDEIDAAQGTERGGGAMDHGVEEGTREQEQGDNAVDSTVIQEDGDEAMGQEGAE